MADEAVPRGLPTLDRDVLKLLFRNIVAQKAIWNGAGTIIAKLAATNKTCLNAIGHVTNEFCTSTITSQGMTLKCDDRTPSIVVTRAQFVWLVQWDMLHLKDITIACRNAREWQPLIENFHFPSLETLEYVVPLHKPRKLTDNSSLDLVADIIKLNASSIKELHGVPVWKLPEPLPALRLELFTFTPQLEFDDLGNTKEADKLVSELGFRPESFVIPYGPRIEFDHKLDLGPGRELRVQWTVYDQSRYY